ncbi:MAG: prepilin-type N-terminal cleavage/methylation domain-containing protein [Lachnospiraceae bacterium]|nr:prepilin-type N-terminal cleavage/methylation domain-containing protein [Lachnospiraceae bacterium]
MNKGRKENLKLNDNGLSLVELIVAISIGVIVSGSIAALMNFAINMYRNESANVSAQYELQTNVNQMMDTIMGANCVVIQKVDSPDPAGRITHYAAFGKFDGTGTHKFDGVVFVSGSENPAGSGRFNIYMDRGIWNDPSSGNAKEIVAKRVTEIEGAMGTTPNPYLLGEGSTKFRIEPKVLTASPSKTYVNISSTGYKNPLGIEVELNFDKDATGKVVHKHVEEEALIRNKISVPIYIDGSEYKLDKSN